MSKLLAWLIGLQFEDTRGQKLREVFPVRSRRLRPGQPLNYQLPSLDEYEVRNIFGLCSWQ